MQLWGVAVGSSSSTHIKLSVNFSRVSAADVFRNFPHHPQINGRFYTAFLYLDSTFAIITLVYANMNSPGDETDKTRPSSTNSKQRPASASRLSRSPSRLRRDVNSFEEHPDPIVRSATKKLADACNRFDRARDGLFLKVDMTAHFLSF